MIGGLSLPVIYNSIITDYYAVNNGGCSTIFLRLCYFIKIIETSLGFFWGLLVIASFRTAVQDEAEMQVHL